MKGLQADVARMHLAKSHNLGNISEETPSSVSKAPGPAPAAAGSAAPARAEAPRTGDLEIQSSGTSFSVQALKMNADLAKSIMEANKATLNKGGVVGSKTGNVSAGGASASGAPVASSSTGGKRTSRLIRSTSEAAGPGSDGGANKKVTWGDGDFAEGAEQPDHSKPSGRNLVGWGDPPAPRAPAIRTPADLMSSSSAAHGGCLLRLPWQLPHDCQRRVRQERLRFQRGRQGATSAGGRTRGPGPDQREPGADRQPGREEQALGGDWAPASCP